MEKILETTDQLTLCDGFFHDRYNIESEILHSFHYSPSYQGNCAICNTRNPTREFVRQQLIQFEKTLIQTVYMIYENAAQLELNYLDYGIKGIKHFL